jgi:hypothetical protein
MNHLPFTYTILHRTDINEYLTHVEIWDRNSVKWSPSMDDAFLFNTYSDAEINGRMVLEWLKDPLNRNVNLMSANAGIRECAVIVGQWHPVNVTGVSLDF